MFLLSFTLFSTSPLSDPLLLFLVQIVLILVLVRILAFVLNCVNQPVVIGEIIAGILLGPSALGQIHGFSATIFPPANMIVLSTVANVALIFFMFFLGLEVDVRLMSRSWKSAIPTAVMSIVIPFGCGAAIAPWVMSIDDNSNAETSVNTNVGYDPSTAFLLFLGTAFSFTAFPVLARILATNRMLSSPLGMQALSCAAIDDVTAWCVLALTLSYAQDGSAVGGLSTAAIAIGFVATMGLAVRPGLERIYAKLISKNDEMNKNFIALLFLILCTSSWFAQAIGIHAFFGAFVSGICVPRSGRLREELAMRIELLIVEVLLPLYFANSGLSTDLTLMNDAQSWFVCAIVCILASVSKIVPGTLMTRLMTGCFGFGIDQQGESQIKHNIKEAKDKHDDAHRRNEVDDSQTHATGAWFYAAEATAASSPNMTRASSPRGSLNAKDANRDSAMMDNVTLHIASTATDDAHCSFFRRHTPASWRTCLCVGVLMNTRGLVEIVVLNIGLSKGILSVKIFTIMVIMSLVTTMITPPVLHRLFTKQWIEQLQKEDEKNNEVKAQTMRDAKIDQAEYAEYQRSKQRSVDVDHKVMVPSDAHDEESPLVRVDITHYINSISDTRDRIGVWIRGVNDKAGSSRFASTPSLPPAPHLHREPTIDSVQHNDNDDQGWLSSASYFSQIGAQWQQDDARANSTMTIGMRHYPTA